MITDVFHVADGLGARAQGADAFKRGFSYDMNPFVKNPQLTMWSVGWKTAESELVESRLQETLKSEGLRRDEEFKSVQVALEEVRSEIRSARAVWPRPSYNAHEAYAVLLEEVDELWDHVKTKQKNRDLAKMRKEAMQVAAMAVRFMIEVCDEVSGRR